jgi:endonuclease-3
MIDPETQKTKKVTVRKTGLKTGKIVGEKARRSKADWVCQTLNAEYGFPVWRSHADPTGALIATILSQHTSDKNSEKAFDTLRRRFPNWDAVRVAPVEEITEAIRGGGLAAAKAPRIKNVLQAIYDQTGSTRLDFLDALPTEEASAYLRSYPGVGPKTMACVMLFSLGKPVLPVDTHVFRISHRLGLIERKIGEAKAHDALASLLKPEQVYPFHIHLIRHGRRVCTAQRPRCERCVLQEKCDYYRMTGRDGTETLPSAKSV